MRKQKKYSSEMRADLYIDSNIDDIWKAIKELQMATIILIVIAICKEAKLVENIKKFVDKRKS
jgi:hypothetical protein